MIDKNLVRKYLIYLLALVGCYYMLSLIIPTLVNIYQPTHQRITKLYQYQIDPYNLIISTVYGFLGFYIAWQANLIAQRTLEQNRPIVVVDEKQTKTTDTNQGSSLLTIFNEGNFEASEIDIFIEDYKNNTMVKINTQFEFLAPKTKLSYILDGLKSRSLIIKYKNPLTNKIYLYGSIIKFNVEIGENKFESFTDNSFITSKKYNEILKQVLTRNEFNL